MKFTSTSSRDGLLKIAGGVLVLGAILAGGAALLSGQETSDIDAERTRAMLAEQARIAQEQKLEELDNRKPWLDEARPEVFAGACLDVIAALPADAAGYEPAEISCRNGVVTGTYRQTRRGYPNWLEEWHRDFPSLALDMTHDGATAYLSRKLPDLPARASDDLGDMTALAPRLYRAAAIDGSDVSISQPVAPSYPEYPDYVPRYRSSDLTIRTEHPGAWVDVFSETGGLVLSSVEVDPSTMTYNFKGKIYVSNR